MLPTGLAVVGPQHGPGAILADLALGHDPRRSSADAADGEVGEETDGRPSGTALGDASALLSLGLDAIEVLRLDVARPVAGTDDLVPMDDESGVHRIVGPPTAG